MLKVDNVINRKEKMKTKKVYGKIVRNGKTFTAYKMVDKNLARSEVIKIQEDIRNYLTKHTTENGLFIRNICE